MLPARPLQLLLGRLAEAGAAVAFAVHAWPRVKPEMWIWRPHQRERQLRQTSSLSSKPSPAILLLGWSFYPVAWWVAVIVVTRVFIATKILDPLLGTPRMSLGLLIFLGSATLFAAILRRLASQPVRQSEGSTIKDWIERGTIFLAALLFMIGIYAVQRRYSIEDTLDFAIKIAFGVAVILLPGVTVPRRWVWIERRTGMRIRPATSEEEAEFEGPLFIRIWKWAILIVLISTIILAMCGLVVGWSLLLFR
jgi:hypothetical protein